MNYEFYLLIHLDKRSLPWTRDFVIVHTLHVECVSTNSLN